MQLPELLVADAAAWRVWLAEHHERSAGVSLVLAKKGITEPTSLTYDQALEEALCYGWMMGKSSAATRPPTGNASPTGGHAALGRNATSASSIGCTLRGGCIQPACQSGASRWEAAYAGSASIEVPPDLAAALAA